MYMYYIHIQVSCTCIIYMYKYHVHVLYTYTSIMYMYYIHVHIQVLYTCNKIMNVYTCTSALLALVNTGQEHLPLCIN